MPFLDGALSKDSRAAGYMQSWLEQHAEQLQCLAVRMTSILPLHENARVGSEQQAYLDHFLSLGRLWRIQPAINPYLTPQLCAQRR